MLPCLLLVIFEMNVKEDDIHMMFSIPLKIINIRNNRILKGKTAIKLFKSFSTLRKKPYWEPFLELGILCKLYRFG